MLTAITGINWGDEGKGRMVDLLSQEYNIVVRYQGGNNAGHTVVTPEGKFVLNLLPSGILRPDVVCVMGNGMVIDPAHLEKEIAALRAQGIQIDPSHLKISDRATICMPYHVAEDGLEEDRLSKSGNQFGSTRRGIAYSYGDKYMKKTLRMGDLLNLDQSVKDRLATIVEWKNLTMEKVYGQKPIDLEEMWAWCQKYAELFKDYICDAGAFLDKADREGQKILFEAQLGALRDIDFGIYPFTSSSNVIGSYAPIGAGIPGHKLHKSIGIMKAYSSCVGEGPFTAELAMTEEEKNALREAGHEFGAATGRPRRVGPFDVVASRYGVFCQGADELALTLLDVLDYMEEIPVVEKYLVNGEEVDRFPMGEALDNAKPVVKFLPGWHCDITACRTWESLPQAAKDYVEYLEKAVGCKIKYVSVGAARDAYLVRE
ncbi:MULTISPECIES: adenylosuccinate synthase [Eubacteriales]|uniref:adenylosuccinate synthase n=1 Tax=Eubacteriales TaxID=186802 RepID=UPI000B39EBFA|nr:MULTISPECIES: adenylosuccinate synthase [Eubacteriales]MDY4166595.1 adenylosuccinate synthase [Fournierella sp.]OUP23647.1 adenylosuccinate synthase [Gemmiger sp. An194]